MVSLAVTLDGVAVVWGPDGRDRRVRVGELITGNGTNALRPDEVLRAVELPRSALAARTGFRKIALSRLGRSGGVLTGRAESDGSCVFVITAATLRPVALRYRSLPGTSVLMRDVENADGYYTDPLGSAESNQKLSLERANAVRDYMVNRGVPASIIRLNAAAVGGEMRSGLGTNSRMATRPPGLSDPATLRRKAVQVAASKWCRKLVISTAS